MKDIKTVKDINTYIENVQFIHEYDKVITVEHRSNNPKRDFLFVNGIQCKHIPCSPSQMVEMCKQLADRVNNELKGKYNILIIGFAETATAIGTIVGEHVLGAKYILHTTREEVKNSIEVVTFEETHSHATTQKLLVDKQFDINKYDYILFVEDEISTGNTILNFINAFEKQHNTNENGDKSREIRYGVASVCNWQDNEMKDKFKQLKIDTFALVTGDLKDVNSKMLEDTRVSIKEQSDNISYTTDSPDVILNGYSTFFENRTGHELNRTETNKKIEAMFESLCKICSNLKNIHIIGTEEYMEIPIKLGKRLEERGANVICHATTRSKIDVLSEKAGNINIVSRYKVPSAYDSSRDTYIYNMDKHCDITIVLTDTYNKKQFMLLLNSLQSILRDKTNYIIGVSL